MECDKAKPKSNFSSLRWGKYCRSIHKGAAAAVDLGLDEKQALESRSKEALSPKFLVVFGSPPQLRASNNFYLLTSLNCCSYNTDASAEGTILHLWGWLPILLQLMSAPLGLQREISCKRQAAVCAGSTSHCSLLSPASCSCCCCPCWTESTRCRKATKRFLL